MSSPRDSDESAPRRALPPMQTLMITAEGRTDAGGSVTMLFPFYVGVVRPQPLPEGVAGPAEPERVVMINPITQSMVFLPAGLEASQPDGEQPQGGEGDEEGAATTATTTVFFDPFAAFMREVLMMSAMEDRPGPPPASKASIEALKTVEEGVLARDAAAAAEQGCSRQECAVCLEELMAVATESVATEERTTCLGKGEEEATASTPEDDETSATATATASSAALVVKEMPCGHRYHGDCIEKWLGMHGSCPVCRYRMPEEEKEPAKKFPTDAIPDDRPDTQTHEGGRLWVATFDFPPSAAAGSEDAAAQDVQPQQQ